MMLDYTVSIYIRTVIVPDNKSPVEKKITSSPSYFTLLRPTLRPRVGWEWRSQKYSLFTLLFSLYVCGHFFIFKGALLVVVYTSITLYCDTCEVCGGV